MNVRALRGVCIGPGRHLVAGELADLDASLATYLQSIGAVAPAPAEAVELAPPQPSIETPVARKTRKES